MAKQRYVKVTLSQDSASIKGNLGGSIVVGDIPSADGSRQLMLERVARLVKTTKPRTKKNATQPTSSPRTEVLGG